MSLQIATKIGQVKPEVSNTRILPPTEVIVHAAIKVEALLKEILDFKLGFGEFPAIQIEKNSTIKNLNSFGKQITTQMMRSNDRFRGYKVDIKNHTLKPSTLFLIGTLCDTFDYTNTSPLFGYSILNVGCGALSSYSTPQEDEDLLIQFLKDNPPIAAEILQILGADVIGIDSRKHCKYEYDYQVAYKHKVMEFHNLNEWLVAAATTFDVISCLNLFDRYDFAYHHSTPQQICKFLSSLRRVISPQGLLYCCPPMLLTSAENQQVNRQIFSQAGFRVAYEGYYYILEPA